jgi:hypothetical protein
MYLSENEKPIAVGVIVTGEHHGVPFFGTVGSIESKRDRCTVDLCPLSSRRLKSCAVNVECSTLTVAP